MEQQRYVTPGGDSRVVLPEERASVSLKQTVLLQHKVVPPSWHPELQYGLAETEHTLSATLSVCPPLHVEERWELDCSGTLPQALPDTQAQ